MNYIVESEYYSSEIYGRTVDSMMIEWYAHNVAFKIYKTEQFKHTDFDKESEGKSLFDFAKEKFFGE